MKTRLAIYQVFGAIFLLLCFRLHAQNAQSYSGSVGKSSAALPEILSDHTTVDPEAPSWVSSALGLAVTVHQEQSRKYHQYGVLSFHDLRTRKVFATLPCPARITEMKQISQTSHLRIAGCPNNKDETQPFAFVVDASTGKIIEDLGGSGPIDPVVQFDSSRPKPNWAISADITNDPKLEMFLGETTLGIFRKDTTETFLPLTSQGPKLRQWAFSRDGRRIMNKFDLNVWYQGDPDEASFDPVHLVQEKVRWGESTRILDSNWVSNKDDYVGENEAGGVQRFHDKKNKERAVWTIRGTYHRGSFDASVFPGIEGECQTWRCAGSSMGYYACAVRTRPNPQAQWKETFTDTSKLLPDNSTVDPKQEVTLFHDIGIIRAGGDVDKEYLIGIYNGGRLALQDLTTHDVLCSKVIDRYQSFGALAVSPLKGIVGVPLSGNGLQFVKVTADLKFEMLAQLWITGEDAWALVLPDGRYAMSTGNSAALDLRKDGVSYPLEDFDLQLNQPDAVAKAMGADEATVSAFTNARKQRLARMGNPNISATTAATAITTPIKIVLSQPLPLLHDQSELTIPGKAICLGDEASNLHLFVNDVPIFGRSGLALQGTGSERSFSVKAPLGTGSNKVQLQIRDASGGLSLFTTNYVHRSAINNNPKRWILSIGVSDYVNNELDLTYAAKDAQDMADALASAKGRFKDCEKILLTDSQVTREGIADAAKALIQSRPEDEIIVFLAGHGLRDDKGNYYFCPHDFNVTNPAARGLSYDALEAIFQGVPALSRLILMDTCQSGEISLADEQKLLAQIKSSDANPQSRGVKARTLSRLQGYENPTATGKSEELFLDLRRSCGATVLSAAGAMEYAMESETIKNGLFTHATLKTLANYRKSNSAESDLTASRLVKTVAAEVSEMTGGLQKPQSRFVNLASDFPVIAKQQIGAPLDTPDELLKYYYRWINDRYQVETRLMSCFADKVLYFGKELAKQDILRDCLEEHRKYQNVSYQILKLHSSMAQPDASCVLRYRIGFNHMITPPGSFQGRIIEGSYRKGELEMQATLRPFGMEWKITELKVINGK